MNKHYSFKFFEFYYAYEISLLALCMIFSISVMNIMAFEVSGLILLVFLINELLYEYQKVIGDKDLNKNIL